MSSRGEGLLFAGPTGCGKTHLAAAIGNALLEDGRRVVFKRVTDLYYELRGSFDGGNSETDIITPCRQADLLILDDLEAMHRRLGRAASCNPWWITASTTIARWWSQPICGTRRLYGEQLTAGRWTVWRLLPSVCNGAVIQEDPA